MSRYVGEIHITKKTSNVFVKIISHIRHSEIDYTINE